MAPARVILSGDDPLALSGLAVLLAGRAEVTVVGDGADADAVLWDAGPSGAGIPPRYGDAPIVALVASDGQAAGAIREGARAVLRRDAPGDAIAAALVAAASGLAVLDAGLAREWLRPPEEAEAGGGLTAREREVLALLAEGLANKAIAARLGVSEHTAKFHVNSILAKLGAESRAAAIVKAARLGLVAL